MVIKMVALGIFGRRCYLGDTWNRLDFFIVMTGWAKSFFFLLFKNLCFVGCLYLFSNIAYFPANSNLSIPEETQMCITSVFLNPVLICNPGAQYYFSNSEVPRVNRTCKTVYLFVSVYVGRLLEKQHLRLSTRQWRRKDVYLHLVPSFHTQWILITCVNICSSDLNRKNDSLSSHSFGACFI